MDDILNNNRICPQPQKWNRLWEIINSKSDERIFPPLILAAWWTTDNEEKLGRFKYHLECAERLHATEEVEIYLQALKENDWHHKGE